MGNILGTLSVVGDILRPLLGSHVRSWDPARQMEPLPGKVVLITGGNVGIGRQAALDLARYAQPAEIWIASRNAETGQATAAEIERVAADAGATTRARFLKLDLTSFASVRDVAREFTAAVSRLDVLILNAGLMGGPKSATTEDGYELRFGLNYVGHALLVQLLLPLLQTTAAQAGSDRTVASAPRIVALSSAAHKYVASGGIRFDALKGPSDHVDRLTRYGQSKLALALWVREMAERYPEITTFSIHPGLVKTNLFSNSEGGFMYHMIQRLGVPAMGVTVAEGTKNTLWAATSKNVVSGEYYAPVGRTGEGSSLLEDRGLIRKLWEWTEEELKGREL